MKSRQFILGVAFWVAAAAVGGLTLRSELTTQSSSLTALSSHVTDWLSGQQSHFKAVSSVPLQIALHDPVFLQAENGDWLQVGVVTNVDGTQNRDPAIIDQVSLSIYDSALAGFPDGFVLQHYTTPMGLDWVVQTMIPEPRQQQIAELLAKEWQQQQHQILEQLRPIVRNGLRTALNAVEAELPEILHQHTEQFQALGDRYELEIVKSELVPLVRREILPIVEQEAIPVATELGKALWNRVSLWSFTWRFVYDKSPLPKRNAVREEFQRFVNEEALPELRSRTDQFIEMTEVIVKRVMENPEVRMVLQRNLKRVVEDPELHQLIWTLVRKAVVENQTLKTELEAHFASHETQAALQLTGERLEPVVRQVGDLIFGTREGGISPEFSRILRSQILLKDRRWLVMVPADPTDQKPVAGTVSMQPGQVPMIYPLSFAASELSPLTPAQEQLRSLDPPRQEVPTP